MGKEILTIADASELLSLPESEVQRLLEAGELPGRRVGPHWFISRQRLMHFIAGDEQSAARSAPARPDPPVVLPDRVLNPGWRCKSCGEQYSPEIAECARCGTVRATPLIGYRLPRTINAPKVN